MVLSATVDFLWSNKYPHINVCDTPHLIQNNTGITNVKQQNQIEYFLTPTIYKLIHSHPEEILKGYLYTYSEIKPTKKNGIDIVEFMEDDLAEVLDYFLPDGVRRVINIIIDQIQTP